MTPEYILRKGAMKCPTWQDVKVALAVAIISAGLVAAAETWLWPALAAWHWLDPEAGNSIRIVDQPKEPA